MLEFYTINYDTIKASFGHTNVTVYGFINICVHLVNLSLFLIDSINTGVLSSGKLLI
jgi:hypothetical protein